MMYYVMIPAVPNPVRPANATTEIFQSDDYGMAKTVADDYKERTGTNAQVESRAVVYTTQTLDEAMADAAAADGRAIWDGTAEHARVINARARAYDNRTEVARVARVVQVGDHDPEIRPRDDVPQTGGR
jgi:hypothetical protein